MKQMVLDWWPAIVALAVVSAITLILGRKIAFWIAASVVGLELSGVVVGLLVNWPGGAIYQLLLPAIVIFGFPLSIMIVGWIVGLMCRKLMGFPADGVLWWVTRRR